MSMQCNALHMVPSDIMFRETHVCDDYKSLQLTGFPNSRTLARRTSLILILVSEFIVFTTIRFSLIPLCCADESTKDETVASTV